MNTNQYVQDFLKRMRTHEGVDANQKPYYPPPTIPHRVGVKLDAQPTRALSNAEIYEIFDAEDVAKFIALSKH